VKKLPSILTVVLDTQATLGNPVQKQHTQEASRTWDTKSGNPVGAILHRMFPRHYHGATAQSVQHFSVISYSHIQCLLTFYGAGVEAWLEWLSTKLEALRSNPSTHTK
jgi:hypothetical protein